MSIFGKRSLNLLNSFNSFNSPNTPNTLNSLNSDESKSLIIMEHQLKAYNHLKTHRGILLFHKMGSGKTISSLYAAIKFNLNTVIIGPKSSKKSFFDDLNKLSTVFDVDKSKFEFYTYQKIQKVLTNNFDLFRDRMIIIDEAHHLRNQSSNIMFIINSLVLAKKIILLSGTPIVNHPVDIAVLINIIYNSEILTTDKSLFDFYYIEQSSNIDDLNMPNIEFKNISELRTKLSNSISYYKPVTTSDKLLININYPKVYLSKAQLLEYKSYIVRLINPITKRIVHLETDINAEDFNINFQTLDTRKANAFLTATRQLSNTVDNDSNSPKIIEITENVAQGPKPAIIYSNYLANGIYPISVKLIEMGISFKMIKGTTTFDQMNQIINEYNNRSFDVLLISSAASESIDLKNTRQIHIMEPHFNDAKIDQIIGRAIRYKSHEKLNQIDRTINIYHWCSIFPNIIQYKTADEYLIYLSKKKSKLINKFIDIIKSVTI